jgi:ADP-heptose:LPS heptosyltransferase
MDVRLQKLVDRMVGVPACGLISALRRVVPAPGPQGAPRKVLVILLSEMGSLVLAEPMFRRIRDRWPGAELHVMLFARNRQMLDLLGVVEPSRVIAIRDQSIGTLVPDLLRAILKIRRDRIDTIIDCELFARVSAVISGLSSASRRAGFHRATQEGLYRGSFMSAPVPYNPYRHLSHQLVALVDSIDSQDGPVSKGSVAPGSFDPPEFVAEPGEIEREVAALERDHPAVAGRRLALVYPSGGLLPIRAWPEEHYVALAQGLLGEDVAVGIIGMPEDRALAERIQSACGRDERCVNLAGYTRSVRHLLCLFHRASLLVTNDGGPGQFAAMTPVPTIVFFGPETPTLYRSWSRHAHAYFTGLACAPCLTAYNHRTSPCNGDNQCLKMILPADVLAHARTMMAPAPIERVAVVA